MTGNRLCSIRRVKIIAKSTVACWPNSSVGCGGGCKLPIRQLATNKKDKRRGDKGESSEASLRKKLMSGIANMKARPRPEVSDGMGSNPISHCSIFIIACSEKENTW